MIARTIYKLLMRYLPNLNHGLIMANSDTYNVVTTGQIKNGFDSTCVKHSFAKLFKLSPKKADEFLKSQRTLKKSVEENTAIKYRDKLNKIGLQVLLERSESTENQMLSLTAVKDKTAYSALLPSSIMIKKMTCPKCKVEQINADECRYCGVIVQNYIEALSAKPYPRSVRDQKTDELVKLTVDSISITSFIAAAVIAFLGAFLWSYITLTI